MKNLPGHLLVSLFNAISRLSWKTKYLIADNPSEMPPNGILKKKDRLLEADIRLQPANLL